MGMTQRTSLVLASAASLLAGALLLWFITPHRRAVPEIGFLSAGPQTYQKGFWDGLEAAGWQDGKTIVVHSRLGTGQARDLPALAEDLVRTGVKVIVATNTSAVQAAAAKTSSIPIVMVTSAMPIESGFIESYSRPGRNITGVTAQHPKAIVKSLEVLKEVVPGLRRLAICWNSTNGVNPEILKVLKQDAAAMQVETHAFDVQSTSDLESAFETMKTLQVDGLVVFSDQFLNRNRARMIQLANAHRIPAIYPFKDFAKAGGLMSYGAEFYDLHYRSAQYVDWLLNGANAAELPVEQPQRIELTINLRTADALGIVLPWTLQLRADTLVD